MNFTATGLGYLFSQIITTLTGVTFTGKLATKMFEGITVIGYVVGLIALIVLWKRFHERNKKEKVEKGEATWDMKDTIDAVVGFLVIVFCFTAYGVELPIGIISWIIR